eukprot:XP_024441378.1 uncharacterized protein LOC18094203 isoform X1 [Populus trichocarpa]
MEDQKTDCSSIISDMGAKGLVCHYQFEEGSSQFVFLDIDKETGGASINNSLNFSTSTYLHFISSSNGLLLLSSFGENQLNYHVFNPFTKQSVTLPPHGITRQVIRSGLAFDGKQYQVVLVHAFKDEENGLGPLPDDIELEIFSSETGAWRNHQPLSLSLNVEVPVYWSWQSTMTYRRCLWESEGRVHYTYTDFDGVHTWNLLKEYEHDVYSHNNVYDSEKFRWALVYTIDHKELAKQDPDILYLGNQWEPHNISPFAYVEDSETMYLQLPGIVVAYNTKNRVLQKVCRYKFPGIDFNCCFFFPFIHSNDCHQKNASKSLQVGEVVDLPIEKEVNSFTF